MRGKYSQKLLNHARQSETDVLKNASKRAIQKTADATGELIGNTVTKVSKNLQKNNSEIVTNEHDEEIPKEIHISPEERQNY